MDDVLEELINLLEVFKVELSMNVGDKSGRSLFFDTLKLST